MLHELFHFSPFIRHSSGQNRPKLPKIGIAVALFSQKRTQLYQQTKKDNDK